MPKNDLGNRSIGELCKINPTEPAPRPVAAAWPAIQTAPQRLYPPYEEHYYPPVDHHPCRMDVFRAALADATSGIELGDYDRTVLEWLAGWDTPTVSVLVSLLHRARRAGPKSQL